MWIDGRRVGNVQCDDFDQAARARTIGEAEGGDVVAAAPVACITNIPYIVRSGEPSVWISRYHVVIVRIWIDPIFGYTISPFSENALACHAFDFPLGDRISYYGSCGTYRVPLRSNRYSPA